jgi:hypothetical protein
MSAYLPTICYIMNGTNSLFQYCTNTISFETSRTFTYNYILNRPTTEICVYVDKKMGFQILRHSDIATDNT